jgi:hypothetical protein
MRVEVEMKLGAMAVVLVAAVSVAAGEPEPLDLTTLDVCALVPGAEVAGAVAASLKETRGFNSPDGDIARCVYIVAPLGADGSQPRAFAVELEGPSDFADVRPYVEESTRDVEGLGDGAWTSRDPDTGRIRLWVLRRNVATLYLTGDDEAELRKIAELVLSKQFAAANSGGAGGAPAPQW